MIVYSNNKACLLWLVKARDTESLQSKRFWKHSFCLGISLFDYESISILTNETEREAEKAAMKALIKKRSISLLE